MIITDVKNEWLKIMPDSLVTEDMVSDEQLSLVSTVCVLFDLHWRLLEPPLGPDRFTKIKTAVSDLIGQIYMYNCIYIYRIRLNGSCP